MGINAECRKCREEDGLWVTIIEWQVREKRVQRAKLVCGDLETEYVAINLILEGPYVYIKYKNVIV